MICGEGSSDTPMDLGHNAVDSCNITTSELFESFIKYRLAKQLKSEVSVWRCLELEHLVEESEKERCKFP